MQSIFIMDNERKITQTRSPVYSEIIEDDNELLAVMIAKVVKK